MISYIFKNKTKNILAIVFTVLYIAISIGDILYETVINYEFPVWNLLYLLPYALILVYLLTLKEEYKFKELLFPLAFGLRIVLSIYTATMSTINFLKIMTNFEGIATLLFTVLSNLIVISAYILCFIGTLSNFKKAKLLKIGIIILTIMTALNILLNFIYMGSLLWSDIEQNYLLPIIKSYIRNIIKAAFLLLFYWGIFNLTLNKKSENTDCLIESEES